MTAILRRRRQFALNLLPCLVTLCATTAGRADELRYKFSPGQMFAYRVELVGEGGTERFAGTPVFMVKEVQKDGDAILSVVGRLEYGTRPRGAKTFTPQPGMEAWVGSRVTIDRLGHSVSGRKETVYGPLPTMLQELLPLKKLFFVELPFGRKDTYVNSGTANLWLTKQGGFLGPTIQTTRGYLELNVKAEPDTGGSVKLTKDRSFRTTQGPKQEWKYQGTSRFDADRGLILATDGTYTDDDTKHPLKVTVRLLEGADFDKALKQSAADVARRPPEQDPVEERRVRVDLKSPTRFKSGDDLKRGSVVAHLMGDYQWYLADVVEIVSKHKVAIRLRGSKEEKDVHPGELAHPPADKASKKK